MAGAMTLDFSNNGVYSSFAYTPCVFMSRLGPYGETRLFPLIRGRKTRQKMKNRSDQITGRTGTLLLFSVLIVCFGAGQLQAQEGGNHVKKNVTQIGQAKIEYAVKMEQKAPDRKSCQVQVSLAYLQFDDRAQVDSIIDNSDCAASSGEYTVRIKVRDREGNIQRVEYVESWARADDKAIETQKNYEIGSDMDLVRVSTTKLRCLCDKPDEDAGNP
jgi:hypothetical protein